MGESAFLLLANLMLLARARILTTRPFGATYVVIPLATTVVGLTKRADQTRGVMGLSCIDGQVLRIELQAKHMIRSYTGTKLVFGA